MRLKDCHNIADLRRLAKKKLPAPMFHYVDGGADDEGTMRRNTAAFDDYEPMPRYLVDVSKIDTTTKVLGQTLSMPLFLSPTGASRQYHHAKEFGVARAAAKAGTMYSLSTFATAGIEEIAAAGDGPKMFQTYVFKDRGLASEFIQRCKAAKYSAMCVTVDMPTYGNRERDLTYGFSIPPKFTLAALFSFATSVQWTFNYFRDPDFRVPHVANRVPAPKRNPVPSLSYIYGQLNKRLTWDDAAWFVKEWGGPFAIKGLQSVEDAKRARDIGASAVIISNHGGRQLDSAPAPVDCVAPIRDALGDSIELIVDGGIRRGTHVMKALALGANACSMGRPYLFGLAAGGEKGVDRALTILRTEIERDMALMGCPTIADITGASVRRAGR